MAVIAALTAAPGEVLMPTWFPRSSTELRRERDRTVLSSLVWLVSFMHYDLANFDDETCKTGSNRTLATTIIRGVHSDT